MNDLKISEVRLPDLGGDVISDLLSHASTLPTFTALVMILRGQCTIFLRWYPRCVGGCRGRFLTALRLPRATCCRYG